MSNCDLNNRFIARNTIVIFDQGVDSVEMINNFDVIASTTVQCMLRPFIMNMNYFYFLLTIITVVTSRKILRSFSGNSSAEILSSSVKGLDEFTLCGRIFSHQFSSERQTFLNFPTNTSYLIALGTSAGYPCDKTFYQGSVSWFHPLVLTLSLLKKLKIFKLKVSFFLHFAKLFRVKALFSLWTW